MKVRYFADNNSPVPKLLRSLTDAQLGRATVLRDCADDGSPHAPIARDTKFAREQDFQATRSRLRGERDAVEAGL